MSELILSTHWNIVWDSFNYLVKKPPKDASGKKRFVVGNLFGNNQLGFGVWIQDNLDAWCL